MPHCQQYDVHVGILQFICFSSKQKQWDLRVVNRSQVLTGLSSPRAHGRDYYPLTQEEVAGGGVGGVGLQMRDLAPMFPEYWLSFIVPRIQGHTQSWLAFVVEWPSSIA